MSSIRWCGALVVAFTLQACGGAGSPGFGASGSDVGGLREKPSGGLYFVDPNKAGQGSELALSDLRWGRLVDVVDIDASGNANGIPLFLDLVIRQEIISDGLNYVLSTNPLTQRTRMTIQRRRGDPPVAGQTFSTLLTSATTGLPSIHPKSDDGSSAPPFSSISRNAALVLRFDDLLDDDPELAFELPQLIRVSTGYRPNVHFAARIFFDANYGGVAGGEFHSTRVVVDMSVSEKEAEESPYTVAVNPPGLPASKTFSDDPNVALRIPSRENFNSGQFRVLTNLGGATVSPQISPPADFLLPTQPLVRAMRSGNSEFINRGFLFDLSPPQLMGSFPIYLTDVAQDPTGRPGFDFVFDLTFSNSCQLTVKPGDVIDVGNSVLELKSIAPAPGSDGLVPDVRGTLLEAQPLFIPAALAGAANLVIPYFVSQQLDPACWVRFNPEPGTPPSNDVSSNIGISIRFSEPIRPESLGAFETLRIINNSLVPSDPIPAQDIVISKLILGTALKEVRLVPLLPLSNQTGLNFFVEVLGGTEGVTDLAGNALEVAPGRMHFRLDPDGPSFSNGGIPMRFSSVDEVLPMGVPDFRGQVFLDTEEGIIRPRNVSFGSIPADRGNPIPSIMSAFAPGLQTPLSALGSKMMTVWRYCDMGWRIGDESRYNVDVAGMSWSPITSSVIADFFDRFEMRVSHSEQMPDEFGTAANGPFHSTSGLYPSIFPYTDNILEGTTQKIVHPRELGYRIDPSDLYVNGNGTLLIPFPWNRGGGPLVTYTWRDTSILAVGGTLGVGVPIERETKPPTTIEEQPGSFAPPGKVPTVGLPLLWEIRCFPSSSGLGLNPLDVSVALHRYCRPVFRLFSSGGFDSSGDPVQVNPDFEDLPHGGFNPNGSPPGSRTPAEDPVYYVGQLDIVVRVSRAHTMWFDTGTLAPLYASAIIEPAPNTQPPGTSVLLEYRAAVGFQGTTNGPFDASALDAYGDLLTGEIIFPGENVWRDDLPDIERSRYFQVRFTFFSNIETGQSPTLSAAGFAFSF